ncbi:hypothetical protein MT418_000471 [Batrachochytrium dendrobatidis]
MLQSESRIKHEYVPAILPLSPEFRPQAAKSTKKVLFSTPSVDSTVACVCGVMKHNGQELLNTTCYIPLTQLISAMFANYGPQLYMTAAKDRGAQDIALEKWSEPNCANLPRRRHISYTVTSKQLLFGSTHVRVIERQTIVQSNPEGCVFESELQNLDTPYGSIVSTYQRICLSRIKANQTHIQIHARVNFSRFILLQDTIRTVSMTSLKEFTSVFNRLVVNYTERHQTKHIFYSVGGFASLSEPSPKIEPLPYSEAFDLADINTENQRHRPHGPRSGVILNPSRCTSSTDRTQTPLGMQMPTSPKSMSPLSRFVSDRQSSKLNSFATLKNQEERAINFPSSDARNSRQSKQNPVTPATNYQSPQPSITSVSCKSDSLNTALSAQHNLAESVGASEASSSRELAVWDGSNWIKTVCTDVASSPQDLPPRFITKVLSTGEGPPRLVRFRLFTNATHASNHNCISCSHHTLVNQAHISMQTQESSNAVSEWVNSLPIPGDWYYHDDTCMYYSTCCKGFVTSHEVYHIILTESVKQLLIPVIIRTIGVSGVLNIIWGCLVLIFSGTVTIAEFIGGIPNFLKLN